jgi:hypothetical protein
MQCRDVSEWAGFGLVTDVGISVGIGGNVFSKNAIFLVYWPSSETPAFALASGLR